MRKSKKAGFKLITILLLLIVINGKSQTNTPESQLKADLDLYKAILEKAHAGLYKYHSPKQIDSIFSVYRQQVDSSTDVLTFYKYLSTIITYVGSLHDDISLTDTMEVKMRSQDEFFPYPVSLIGNKLLMNTGNGPIPAGAEIISINRQKTSDILPALYKYYTTDGFNITGKAIGINAQFPWFYRLESGKQKEFEVVYKPPMKQDIQTVTIAPVNWKSYVTEYKQRHSLALDTLYKTYSFYIIDSLSTGVLTIPTFSLGSSGSKKHQAYKQFLKATFKVLRDSQIQNLIVDIRKNGGGSDPNDLLTFSYLTRHRFKENSGAFTLFQDIPFKEYCIDDSADIRDVEENFHDEHNKFIGGKYFQNQKKYNRYWHPNSLAFKGKIYLVVGPAVASAASLFAGMVKSEGIATVVGEETMGGYYGHTGHNTISYRLPNTKISFSIAVVDLKQYVSPNKDISFGSGIIPDIQVRPSQLDFINNYDRVMHAVLGMIFTTR